mmetsp:Transcript_4262/g.8081  ORF Transcript_4262/g.8081 Transcript_4262/m.8081 type:complete len:238 (-) Transcript_4262:457-1170(-)
MCFGCGLADGFCLLAELRPARRGLVRGLGFQVCAKARDLAPQRFSELLLLLYLAVLLLQHLQAGREVLVLLLFLAEEQLPSAVRLGFGSPPLQCSQCVLQDALAFPIGCAVDLQILQRVRQLLDAGQNPAEGHHLGLLLVHQRSLQALLLDLSTDRDFVKRHSLRMLRFTLGAEILYCLHCLLLVRFPQSLHLGSDLRRGGDERPQRLAAFCARCSQLLLHRSEHGLFYGGRTSHSL